MDCSTLGLPVHHQLSEFTQTQAHWVSDAIQPSHPLSSPFPPTFNLSQHQGLYKFQMSNQIKWDKNSYHTMLFLFQMLLWHVILSDHNSKILLHIDQVLFFLNLINIFYTSRNDYLQNTWDYHKIWWDDLSFIYRETKTIMQIKLQLLA